jgi:pimeloyl-ACP methyl ester carboxylesterase
MPTPYPYPTIFLPGIMGSVLRDQYPVEPETVWSPFKMLVKAYDRLTLHPDDVRYELKEPARVITDQLFGIIYSEIIEELRHNLSPQADTPVPVFPFAYDWRQPLENVQNQLAAFIEEVIDRTKLLPHYHKEQYGASDKFPAKVNLVAHSMGGLVVAGYLQKYGEARIYKVASIASPLRGSLEAISKTATGSGTLGTSAGSSREREAARVTPALYYLLPSFKKAVVADEGLLDDIYRPEAWQPSIHDTLTSFVRMYGLNPVNPGQQAWQLLKNMLDAARSHRAGIDTLKLQDSKKWLCIVGVNTNTRVQMRIIKDAKGEPVFLLNDDDVCNNWNDRDPARRILTGDNTVPYLGARTDLIPTEQVVCVTPEDYGLLEIKDKVLMAAMQSFHAALPNMNLVQRLVVSHLKDLIYGDVWGRPSPDLDPNTPWDPPIAGLRKK